MLHKAHNSKRLAIFTFLHFFKGTDQTNYLLYFKQSSVSASCKSKLQEQMSIFLFSLSTWYFAYKIFIGQEPAGSHFNLIMAMKALTPYSHFFFLNLDFGFLSLVAVSFLLIFSFRCKVHCSIISIPLKLQFHFSLLYLARNIFTIQYKRNSISRISLPPTFKCSNKATFLQCGQTFVCLLHKILLHSEDVMYTYFPLNSNLPFCYYHPWGRHSSVVLFPCITNTKPKKARKLKIISNIKICNRCLIFSNSMTNSSALQYSKHVCCLI